MFIANFSCRYHLWPATHLLRWCILVASASAVSTLLCAAKTCRPTSKACSRLIVYETVTKIKQGHRQSLYLNVLCLTRSIARQSKSCIVIVLSQSKPRIDLCHTGARNLTTASTSMAKLVPAQNIDRAWGLPSLLTMAARLMLLTVLSYGSAVTFETSPLRLPNARL